MKWSVESAVTTAFGAALLLVALIGVASYRLVTLSLEAANWVAHTHEALQTLESVQSLMQAVETGQRGYLLTGDETFLEPYNNALPQIDTEVANLRQLTADNPTQQTRIDSLAPLIATRLEYAQESIDLFNTQGPEAAAQAPLTGEGKTAMDQLRLVISSMEAEERTLLQQRNEAAAASARNASAVVIIGGMLVLAVVLAANLVIRRGLAERQQAALALQAAHAGLETRVGERTAELAAANRQLQVQVGERQLAEAEAQRVNRMLRMLSDSNQALVRATSEPELLDQVCRIVVEGGGYNLAWVGYAEHDEDKSVRPVAQAGEDAGYLETLQITWADNERGRRPVGTAIRTGQPVILRDIQTGPDHVPWNEKAAQRGYRALIALPLIVNGQAFGALNIYAADPHAFDTEEQALLTELALDLAFGIESLHTRAERRRAEQQLRESSARAESLAAISKALAEAGRDFEAVLATTTRNLTDALGDACYIRLKTADGQLLALAAAYNRNPDTVDYLRAMLAESPQGVNEGVNGRVMQTGEPVLIAVTTPDALRPATKPEFSRFLDLFPVYSLVFVPLRVQGQTFGVIGMTRETPDRPYTSADLLFLQETADRTALAIANARLFGQVQELNADLEQRVAERTARLETANQSLESEVAERTRAEYDLRRSGQFLDSIVENIPAMVFVKDAGELRFVRFNKAGEELLGFSRDDLLGKNDYDFFPPAEADFFTAKDREVLANGMLLDIPEETIQTRHQGTRLLHTRKVPIQDEDGAPRYLLGISEDVTETRKAEREIRRLNDQLARNNVQLKATNKELEAFAYSVSHDLRAPLRTIDGFSQALLEDYAPKLDGDATTYLNRVRAAAQRMGELIDDLLNLSRVTRAEMHVQPVDLTELAQAIIADLAINNPGRQVEVEIGEGMAGHGDARLLRLVLENLLTNAWKFTGNRPVGKVEVGVVEQEGQPVFFVRDNGAGFDMNYAHKLFGAFQRLHGATEFPGTGIGLATVLRVISRHGGRVWAEAAVDKGATFFFTLGEVEPDETG